jgi:CHAT domain-containing protein
MNEIAELDLGAPLIVLSACRTGEGEIIPGEGVVGLTWAFLHAGAKAVAASLWSVEDESTAELMLAFHRFLRDGHDPVAAMTRAQRERMKANPHPAYWSPFVVVLKPQGG